MNTEGFWGDVMPDEAWGAVLQLSAMGLVLAVCAIGVAIIAVVVWNEWRLWRRARERVVGDLLRSVGAPSDPPMAGGMGPWTCTSCGGEVPHPSPAGPSLTRCQCGAASWTSTVTHPVVFDWDWPAA